MNFDVEKISARVLPTVAYLKAARVLIKKGWTQNTYARSANGRPTSYDDPNACQFCMSGAMERAIGYGSVHDVKLGEAWRALSNAIGDAAISSWNDYPKRTKEEVLAAFDRAIALVTPAPPRKGNQK